MVIAVLRVIDTITVFYFFLEYIVRLLCSPLKKRFFFQVCTNATAYRICRGKGVASAKSRILPTKGSKAAEAYPLLKYDN